MDQHGTMTLKPVDVPGAVLPRERVEDCSLFQLRRWLECRGLKKLGNKMELVERVNNCINAGRESIIFVGVDGGKWYDAKRNLSANAGASADLPGPSTDLPGPSADLPGPVIEMKWGRFPSQNRPQYFNKGHIYTYIAGISVECDDYEVADREGVTEKPFRRGSQFVSSDHINDVFDATDNAHYYIKAKCLASFRAKIMYDVKCILNKLSGAVLSGECICKQSALGKCSHVCALLLFLSKFVEENGSVAVACTSKLREWGLGAKQRNPGAVSSHVYPMLRFHPLLRASFDPRPSSYGRNVILNDFIANMQCGKFTNLQTIVKLVYDDFQMEPTDIEVLIQQVEQFRQKMAEYMNTYPTTIFAVKDAEVQGTENWKRWRTYFLTASNTKTASSLTKISAKSNFLLKNLWQLAPIYNLPALEYGRIHEPVARQQYKNNNLGTNESLVEVGLHVNKNYPHLACSVDGVVMQDNQIIRIIEIKCPKVLEKSDPENFTDVLSDKQKGSFCLEKENGEFKLKPNHPYLYQIVTSMLIFNVAECDFIIWSKINMLVVKINMTDVDQSVIINITENLKNLYYNMYIPEMFLMKVPRNLPLYELNK